MTRDSVRRSVFAVILVFVGCSVVAAAQVGVDQGWRVFRDDQLDLELRYPAAWAVRPWDSRPGYYSQLHLSSGPQADGRSYQILVGYHLVGIDQQQTLMEWSAEYEKLIGDIDGLQLIKAVSLVDEGTEQEILEKTGAMGSCQRANIRNGNLVWFVWADFGADASSAMQSVFTEVIRSLRFGKASPTSLDEIPSVDAEPAVPAIDDAAKLSSDWWCPLYGWHSALCASAYHTGSSAWAIDLGASTGTGVYSAYGGTVIFKGWSDGYGNYVKIDSSGKVHYYAHLDKIYSALPLGGYVSRSYYIGNSGNTGANSTGPHLHFHVSSTDLTGMRYFYPGNYPNTPDPCGYCSR